MTKVILLGPASNPVKKIQPIRFVKYLREDHVWKDTKDKPNQFDNIELLCEDYADGWSLLYAYNEHRENGVLFLGYFNDGVVAEDINKPSKTL